MLEREYSWIYPDSIGADLDKCAVAVCTPVVHVRIESLTDESVTLEATLDAHLSVPRGCAGRTKEEEEAAGLEISLTEVTDETPSASAPRR